MPYNFDEMINRRHTNSSKWQYYGDDVLPMWVADMDFVSPEPVIQALRQRVDHGIFGYGQHPMELSETICQRMDQLYNWAITPEDIIFLPGLVTGINVICRATGRPGDSVLVQTPVYPPFLSAPGHHGQTLDVAPLALKTNGQTLAYEIDYDEFEKAIKPSSRQFLLCHPHNPIGRGYTQSELSRMAEICLRHNLILCSDEIHSDLRFNEVPHIPLASLSPEIASRCITLVAPSKTFNLAGLGCSIAIVQNAELRKQVQQAAKGIVPAVNILGYVAAQAAYESGQEWLDQLLVYLAANRDTVVEYVTKCLPGIRTTVPQATYLAWLDCRDTPIQGSPFKFFLSEAKVALSDGAMFGKNGRGFVRLNFGCPRPLLVRGLNQIREAVLSLS